jgi:hypothetical protein
MAISFSLNAKQLANLQNFAETGESLNLAAKRLLLSILDELLSPNSPKKIAEISDGSSNNQIDSELEPTLDTELTSTEWHLRRLDDRIKAIEIGIEANHYPDQTEKYRGQTIAELQERIDKIEADRLSQDHRFGVHIETLEERIEKLETEIEILTTTPKQPATPNNGESVIFLADSEGRPIQFWSGQVWVDDLDLAYRYKAQQALARAIDKLKKRKLPGYPSPGRTIAFAPIENLLENSES